MARDNFVPTRLSNDEKAALEILAKREGNTLGEMIRQLIKAEATRQGLWPLKQQEQPDNAS